jgi:hypothetical protein
MMPTTVNVEKARISKLPDQTPGNDAPLRPEDTIAVQFNPTSLKISRTNNPDSAATTQGEKRQHTAPQPATLSFDLEFDTGEIADEETGKAKDVRKLTADVRKFVEPSGDKKTDPPPRILFQWGPLSFPGIVTSLTEDLDYFAPDGTPLRAKLSLTITEQDLKFEANATGPGAIQAKNATKPGEPPHGTTPGTRGTGRPTSIVSANAGESLQQLLTRSGADPAAWRSAMNGLTNPIGLSAGAQVQLDASITAGAGISIGADAGAAVGAGVGLGVSAGFSASADVSPQAALGGALGIGASAGVSAGLGVSAGAAASAGGSVGAGVSGGGGVSAGGGFSAGAAGSASAEVSQIVSLGGSVPVTAGGSVGASDQMSAGFLLAAGGGVSVSAKLVTSARADAQTASARSAFDVPVGPAGGSLGVLGSSAAAAVVDARAISYGMSIPLRARASAVTVAGVAAGGPVSVSARAQRAEIVESPFGPPWQQLTDDGGTRSAAGALQRSRDDRPATMRWTPGR